LAVGRDFRVFRALFVADFLETDFDAAMFPSHLDPQVYCPGHC
jgi:hypothetical protein